MADYFTFFELAGVGTVTATDGDAWGRDASTADGNSHRWWSPLREMVEVLQALEKIAGEKKLGGWSRRKNLKNFVS